MQHQRGAKRRRFKPSSAASKWSNPADEARVVEKKSGRRPAVSAKEARTEDGYRSGAKQGCRPPPLRPRTKSAGPQEAGEPEIATFGASSICQRTDSWHDRRRQRYRFPTFSPGAAYGTAAEENVKNGLEQLVLGLPTASRQRQTQVRLPTEIGGNPVHDETTASPGFQRCTSAQETRDHALAMGCRCGPHSKLYWTR